MLMYIPGCFTPCYTYCTLIGVYIIFSLLLNIIPLLFSSLSFDIASSLFQAYYITFDITSSYYHNKYSLKGLGT